MLFCKPFPQPLIKMATRLLLFCLLVTVVTSEANVFGDALYGIAKTVGVVGNKMSPQAFIGFCNTNGYTVWMGPGPQPAVTNIAQSAFSTYGRWTGRVIGQYLPEPGMLGKCDAAGWAKPNADIFQGYQTGGPTTKYHVDANGNTLDSMTGRIVTITQHIPRQPSVDIQIDQNNKNNYPGVSGDATTNIRQSELMDRNTGF